MGRRSDGDLVGIIDRAVRTGGLNCSPTRRLVVAEAQHGGRVRRTRISGVWIGLVAAGVFLILLIIFIAQNLNDAPIHFLGLNGQVSIGLPLLLAGVCGLIIAAVPASARIWQLRKALKKTRVTIFRRRPDSDQPRTTLPIDRTGAR